MKENYLPPFLSCDIGAVEQIIWALWRLSSAIAILRHAMMPGWSWRWRDRGQREQGRGGDVGCVNVSSCKCEKNSHLYQQRHRGRRGADDIAPGAVRLYHRFQRWEFSLPRMSFEVRALPRHSRDTTMLFFPWANGKMGFCGLSATATDYTATSTV